MQLEVNDSQHQTLQMNIEHVWLTNLFIPGVRTICKMARSRPGWPSVLLYTNIHPAISKVQRMVQIVISVPILK